MQIKLNAENFVTGYAIIGGIQGGIAVADIPQEVRENCMSYKYVDSEFVFDDSKIKQAENKLALQQELQSIHQWFEDTDYIVLKVFRGNWLETDERYVEYKAEYIVKKNRMDEITAILEEE